ncbi:3'(2'),5'-bisphosphate nucleotidase [Mesocricetibacter intestinalis]|uniref:3'(2'),5'-bisphosphate nucleotidase CysQ n=1 Tax=Mesocricetibacter intestinalis TaxID=1521930 RepID=A0A4R6V6J4_9PAST|nr:3'(2'),5'-bisphosphate nucleotidase CysQ [Mesocricetibacter intestinalis]TDQ56401.1 3'(2'),5'-bisphosphate nucleotidase [Mesocricetibacter intestinalis]
MEIASQLLPSVLEIAARAGEHLKEFYRCEVKVRTKADNTPVTEADLFLSRFLIEQLSTLSPHLPVLSEENCDIPLERRRHWPSYWLIDPIDGTRQFINRTDQFSVMISLVCAHQPLLGVIHAPILGKTYYAVQGKGAFLQTDSGLRSLTPARSAPGHLIRIAVGSSDENKIQQSLRSPYNPDFIRYGSSGLKAGLVAEGCADCYVRLGNTGEWDTAAAEVILKETGGDIFDLHFQPLSYNLRESLVNPYFVMGSAGFNWKNVFQFDSL